MKARCIILTVFSLLVFPMPGKTQPQTSNAWESGDLEPSLLQSNKQAVVFQIPIVEQIDPALLYVIRRGVSEASATKADAIIFTMDTPGGRVDITRKILEIIREIDVPVYTFVERDAYSAGAIIALSTKIYMAPGSVIGAATPMLMGPTGGPQELSDDVNEKMKSAVAAMVRTAAEQGGHDPELAEAMVRKDVEYRIGTNVVSKVGELLTLTNSEAEGILSEGTVNDINELLEKIGLKEAEIKKLEVTPAEKVARLIAAIAPILLMLGLGGIYLEIKTPGFGLPGIGGAIALALFFFGHHIAGLAGMEDIVLFVIGIGLLFVEVFVTPGFGILGISGTILILISLLSAMSWQVPGELLPAFSGEGSTIQRALINLALGMAGTIILGAAAGRFLPKSRAVRPLVLEQSTNRESGFSAAHDHSNLLGKEGIAEMNLHPAGRAVFDGERINVITHGEFIEKGSGVKITEAHGNRIVVEKA
ncbi:NfeD family protein [Tichowtungia aerotolerans]|uniref:Nodulation protein NfeD n=1 Tax=Tichowtungia aerotolerans TaxID=2697043 RepID=A0A6P1MI80_9BACT|nr:NfeD family protein [Tichowtungia aerotolerans]QHI70755.1 nodulation protein NfeD [Tichowtungia aerotolerans]